LTAGSISQGISYNKQGREMKGVSSAYVVTAAAMQHACARISIRLALFGCVYIEINRVQRHIAIPFYSSHSSPGFLFVSLRRICGGSDQSIHGIYH